MHCTKCGREIGTKSSCPYCGTAQKMANPFVTLGDLRPHDADTDSTASGPIISDSGDPFRMLGNLDGSSISRRDYVQDAPGVGGFVPVGNLDGSLIDQEDTTMDTPGTGGFMPLVTADVSSTSRKVERLDPLGGGGFKPLGQEDEYFVSGKTQSMDPPGRRGFRPMHETIPTNGGSSGAYEKDLPEVPETPALHIQWEWWIILIPLCCTMLLLAIFNIFNKPQLSKTEMLSAAVDDYIQNEIYSGDFLPLMQQYQNAVLEAITYEIQSYDITAGIMEVEFTYIDVLHLADSVTDSNISEDEYYSSCIEIIHSQECKMITEVIQVTFVSSAEGYSVISSEPLINMLSGGVLNYYLELLEGADYE